MCIINAEVVETGEYARQGLDVRPYLIAELARSIAEVLAANPTWVHEEKTMEDRHRDQRRLRVTLSVADAYRLPREPPEPTATDFHNFDFRF